MAGAILGAMDFSSSQLARECGMNRPQCGGLNCGSLVSARAASADLSVRVVGDSSSLRCRMTLQSARPRVQSLGARSRNAERRIFCQRFHDDGREREKRRRVLCLLEHPRDGDSEGGGWWT